MLADFAAIRETARRRGPRKIAVAGGGDSVLDASLAEARTLGLADAIVAADAAEAVSLVRAGQCDVLMKGTVDTAAFMKAVLDRESGLRGDGLMSHIFVTASKRLGRIFLVTDGGITISPTLAEKARIIRNAMPLARALGIPSPLVAVLAAVEKPNPKMPETLDAVELVRMNRAGEITGCTVGGPLALDGCVSPEAAATKGITGPVAGHADIILVPGVATGNAMCKAIVYFAGDEAGGYVAGAAAPVVFLSRADDATTRLNSIALGVLMAGGTSDGR
ncbi:MAG: phosphate acyltransferase [Planctomycetota bacterium]